MDIDRNCEIGGDGVDLVASFCKKRGESRLSIGDGLGGDISAALATSGPPVQPIDVGGGGHNDGGERKESGERGGEAKQHDEGGRKR